MLPPPTQSKIRESLPQTFPLHYDGSDPDYDQGWRDYDYEVWWADEDHGNVDVPAVYLEATTEGMLRQSETPLSQLIERDASAGSATEIPDVRGQRCYDEWNFTVSDSGFEADVTARDRVKALTFCLTQYFRFEASADLYEHSSNRWIIPVLPSVVSGAGDRSAMVDDQSKKRRVFTVRFEYTITDLLLRDAVDKIGYDINDSGDVRYVGP